LSSLESCFRTSLIRRQSGVNIVLVSVYKRSWLDELFNNRTNVTCLTFSNTRNTACPPRSIIPKIGGLSVAAVPRPRFPFSLLLLYVFSLTDCVLVF
jgi:hypothetical protein